MQLNLIIILLFACVLYACTTPRYFYSPSPANTPYFTEKNESKLAVYFSGGDGSRRGSDSATALKPRNHGVDLQGAYAVSNHFAIAAGYSQRSERDVYAENSGWTSNFFNRSVITYKRRLFHAGAGYFKKLDPRETTTFNLYGGIGFGKFSLTDNGRDNTLASYSRYHHTDITQWYLQPSFHFMPEPYFSMAMALKFSFVHYGNVSTSYTADEQRFYSFDWLPGKTVLFFEPGLSVQAGLARCDWIRVEGIFCVTTSPETPTSRLRSRFFCASIGLNIDLIKLDKSHSAKK